MTTSHDPKLAELAVRTIRFLAVDAVERANSGHPGLPMGAADVAFVVWSRFLRYDPRMPDWPDRDRFVLSAGHGCMLLYALLHLAGYELSLEELRDFRQWGSRTPGHPEFGHTVGVEATTGPLGQGVSNAVGMALASRMLAERFNGSGGFDPVGSRIFALASDGDLMEGISGEAASLAGHLRLGNLVVLYDDNRITIEGDTALAFSEDVARRYEAYGWHTQHVDGHDRDAIAAAVDAALDERERPSILCCRTHIAFGAPTKHDSAEAHGAPLGAEEVAAAKRNAGWPLEPTFTIPDEVTTFWKARAEEGAALRTAWEGRFAGWKREHPELAGQWDALWTRDVPADLTERLLAAAPTGAGATRAHGGAVLQEAAKLVPALVGGSADLAPSTKTLIKGSPSVGPGEYAGRNFHFGIREHAMGAMVNGILYHGAFRPFGATFLVFSDYMRAPIRLAALSGLPAIWIFTHDSVFVGEDGPTHQPIEHAAALRLIPNLHVFRPADGKETALAWGMALERTDGPTALLLSRQTLPPLEREVEGERGEMRRGAYLVAGDDRPDAVVAATGSEVQLAVAAREALAADGKRLNVVSVPCLEIFLAQEPVRRKRLFPEGVPVATIEAGRTDPWRVLAGMDGLTLGIDRFGASAPGEVVADKLGLSAERVTARDPGVARRLSGLRDDLERIAEALRQARDVLARFTPGDVAHRKKDGGDPVTAADTAVDELLRGVLPREGEGWLSEESEDDPARLGCHRVWVVDPIDGTREFIRGTTEWCVSVGLVEDGRPVAGGICNPLEELTVIGAVGHGILVNGEPGGTRALESLEGIDVVASRSEVRRGDWARFRDAPFRYRAVGSVAYKLALVAAGRADATWTLRPKHEWDVAGGVALVLAAGGSARLPGGGVPRFNRPSPRLPGLLAAPTGLVAPINRYLDETVGESF